MAPEEPDILETAPEDGPQTGSAPAQPVLIYVGSAENDFEFAGTTFPLAGVNRILLGRAKEPGKLAHTLDAGVLRIGVPTQWASSTHAEVTLNPSNALVPLEVKDLGSRNGTMIDGNRIQGITALAPGQVFETGRAFWIVRRHTAPILDDEVDANFDPTTTGSPTLRHVYRSLARLAPGSLPILLVGETGSGKEHVAAAIHRASGRKGEFVRTTLAGADARRTDQILFGNVDDSARLGVVARAAGGTLFIDDVSDLTQEAQSGLLQALNQHAALQTDAETDVRLISGSLRELGSLVSSQRFRGDLYSRLAGYEARLPSLRERSEDIGLLTRILMRRLGEDMQIESPAFRRLLGHSWPFNIRELGHSLAAAAGITTGNSLVTRSALNEVLRSDTSVPESADGIRAMRQEIVRQLVAFDGDTGPLAQTFGVDADQIELWLERFDIEPSNYRPQH